MVEMALRRREGVWWGGAAMVAALAAVAGTAVVASPLAAQEPAARAYLEPPDVEVGERFTLNIEVSGVTEVEAVGLQDQFPFPVAPANEVLADFTDPLVPVAGEVLPFTFEITPATGQSPGSVTVSYAMIAQEAGFFEFGPIRIAANGRTLETEAVMLLVTPPSEPAVARAWVEPPEVKLMERFTLFVEVPNQDLSTWVDLPDVSEFAFRDGASGSLSPRRPAFYQFVATSSGAHQIGPLTVRSEGETFEIEPVTLVVSDESGEIEAHANVNTEQAWVGGAFEVVVEVTGARELDGDPILPDLSAFAERLPGASYGRGGITFTRYYRFRALVAGDFEIGPITVSAAGQTAVTEPVRLTIAEGPPDVVAVPEDLRVAVAADKRRVHVGEPVVVSYRLLARDGRGFEGWSLREVSEFTPPRHEHLRPHDLGSRFVGARRVSVDDRSYRPHREYLVAFVPLELGEKTIGPAEFQLQIHRFPLLDRRELSSEPTRARTMGEWTPMTVATDPVVVEVVPLPTEGRPQSFRGHVGRVEVASRLNRTDAGVGDTVVLRVEITGGAFLRLMPDPEIVLPDGFDLLGPEASDEPSRLEVGQPAQRTLVYRLVATREGSYRIPAVELAWFDPETQEYGVARAESFDLTVGPAGSGARR